nr:MAG TPA: zinc knuckle protein [Caudoviricetes sp.]
MSDLICIRCGAEGRTRTGTGYSGLACFKNHC